MPSPLQPVLPLGMAAFALLIAALLMPGAAHAQRQQTTNTLAFEEGMAMPKATLSDIAWLAGHWQGEALGGLSEEIWSPPEAGTMMGMYRLMRGDSVVFYELLTLVEESESLVLKLKHFNADLSGWEERDEVRTFPLVKRGMGTMYFGRMTFERISEDEVRIFLAIQTDDGSVVEETFSYRRAGSK